MAVARRIDALIADLDLAARSDDISAYKKRIFQWARGRPQYWTACELRDAAIGRRKIRESNDWTQISHDLMVLYENVRLEFLSSLDLDYTSAAFGDQLKLIPLFLTLLPELGAQLNEDAMRSKQRGKQPQIITGKRKLLERSYALLHRFHANRWPADLPSREELARVTHLAPEALGKIFLGTKKMTSRSFAVQVNQMFATLNGQEPSNRAPSMVVPLIAALEWDSVLNWKPRSAWENNQNQIFLTGDEDYLKWWSLNKEKWANHLKDGKENWPTWFTGDVRS